MGILDSVIGSLLGGSNANAGSSGMGGVLSSLLGGGQSGAGDGMAGAGGMGGLGGIVSKFEQAGRGNVAQSWIGNGANHPVSPQQLQDVFGDQVPQMASQAGMNEGDFLSQLSQHLPNAVSGMTPDGRMPADNGSIDV